MSNNIKKFFLCFLIDGESTITPIKQIDYIPFKPKKMIIKYIDFVDTEEKSDTGNYLIWSDLVNDYIGSFNTNNNNIEFGLEFILNSDVVRSNIFQLQDINQNLADNLISGELIICIEFTD